MNVTEKKRLSLIRETKQELNKIIKENLTVNDSVMKCVEEIEKYIYDNIKNAEITKTFNGGAERTMSFRQKMFGNEGRTFECSINVVNYNFKDNSFFNKYNANHDFNLECVSSYREVRNRIICVMTIRYISINFKPLSKFYQDVPHEVNHIFQQYKNKRTYPDYVRYTQIASNYNFSQDKYTFNLSKMMYLLNKSEEDSFVSSVYNYVKHSVDNGDMNIDKLLSKTEAFENIITVKELFNSIKNNKEHYIGLIKNEPYNFKNWNMFIRKIKELIKRYERKFAMVSKKCKCDFVLYETHTFFSGNFVNFLLFN